MTIRGLNSPYRTPMISRERIEAFMLERIAKHGQFTDADRGRWLAAANRLVKADSNLELTFQSDSEYVYHYGRSRYYRPHWTLKPKEVAQ